jgi:hypothetical protein
VRMHNSCWPTTLTPKVTRAPGDSRCNSHTHVGCGPLPGRTRPPRRNAAAASESGGCRSAGCLHSHRAAYTCIVGQPLKKRGGHDQ